MAGAGFGAYGKIPALGDFFRIGLGPAFVEAWDGWLQTALTTARAAHGARWTACYMSAPIWRFATSAGQAGPEAMVGIVMPSVDRVGRQFPLTLAAPVADAPPPRLLAVQDEVLARLELVALNALDDGMDRDTLAAQLAGVVPAPVPAASRLGRVAGGLALAGPGNMRALLADLAPPPPPGAVFAAAIEGGGRLLALTGLPAGAAAAALFDLGAPFWTEARA